MTCRIYIYIYRERERERKREREIRSSFGVEHSSEGIYGCRSHNTKLFERIVSGKT